MKIQRIAFPMGLSNWEGVAFMLTQKATAGKFPTFIRSEFMSTNNLKFAINLLQVVGHKHRPTQPEATLQRTIQNLRDHGYITFYGNGEYELTQEGINVFNAVREKFKIEKFWDDVLKLVIN